MLFCQKLPPPPNKIAAAFFPGKMTHFCLPQLLMGGGILEMFLKRFFRTNAIGHPV
jgi:hypothetical protein